jgi:ArsR family transcriptional regulator, lead/cadmium/zinc/bismuth-responsive transcriptional repressor
MAVSDPAGAVDQLAAVFGLLADPGRLRLLVGLLDAGELSVGELAAVAEMSESTASHALRLLRAARVVKPRRSGRTVYYSLSDGHVRVLLEVGLAHLTDSSAWRGSR